MMFVFDWTCHLYMILSLHEREQTITNQWKTMNCSLLVCPEYQGLKFALHPWNYMNDGRSVTMPWYKHQYVVYTFILLYHDDHWKTITIAGSILFLLSLTMGVPIFWLQLTLVEHGNPTWPAGPFFPTARRQTVPVLVLVARNGATSLPKPSHLGRGIAPGGRSTGLLDPSHKMPPER